MRRWKPQPSAGIWVGLALSLVALSGAAFFGVRLGLALARPPDAWPVDLRLYGELLAMAGCLVVTAFFGYRVGAALTMAYEIDRNGLYIHWMGNRAVVPLAQVTSVDSGAPGARRPWPLLQGIGCYWGQGRTTDGRRLHLFTTRSPATCLVIHTDQDSYAISPQETESFVQDFEQRRRLGVTTSLAPAVEEGRIFFFSFWNDRVVRRALALALLINLLTLGLIAARYPDLPALLELRSDAAGQVAELRPRHQVLFLPLAAFVVGLLNAGLGMTLYQREATGARMLQIASVLAQLLFGIAVLGAIL